MKTKEYKNFSWQFHQKAGRKPIVAQIELTYKCLLHCKYCYTACYNNKENIKKELPAGEIKKILDKCRQAKTLWLCFTGGDPLTRKDFPEIYLYAKKMGFIVSVFSSLTFMDKGILRIFKKQPPFGIETTLNAATPVVYRKVTGAGFFREQIDNIKKLISNGINVRIKTQITRLNVGEIDKIKDLVESLGRDFRPSTMIFAGLDHDISPCRLRLGPGEAIRINKEYGYYDEDVRLAGEKLQIEDMITKPFNKLFSCAIGGHAFEISPQGRMFLCSCLKKPDYDLLKKGSTIQEGFNKLNRQVHGMKFKTDSICRSCKHRLICKWCPGRAMLERGSLEKSIDYFCSLTKEALRQKES